MRRPSSAAARESFKLDSGKTIFIWWAQMAQPETFSFKFCLLGLAESFCGSKYSSGNSERCERLDAGKR